MGGKARKERQTAAQTASANAASTERQSAQDLQGELTKRRALVGEGLPENLEATRVGAANLRDTGGYDPEKLAPIRAGYSEFANTGGFSEEDKGNFLRRSTAPVAAMYARTKDELNRASMTGGFNPNAMVAGQGRLLRQSAIAGADASRNANVDLATQIRQGRVAGLSGLESVESKVAQGKAAGQDALQRYSQLGVSALSDVDINELRNRLQSGQMSQADAQLLTVLASQDKSLFDNIMSGVKVAAGAASGVAGAF